MDHGLNIAMVTSSFLPRMGGAEMVIHNLAEALSMMGHNVTVFAGRITGSNSLGVSHDYRVVRYGIPIKGMGRMKCNHLALLKSLCRMREEKGIDVVHCHTISNAGCYVRFANRFLKLPVVATPHGGDIQKLPEIGYGIRLRRGWEKKIISNLKSFSLVTAISQSIDSELRKLLPRCYDKERLVSIPNGLWIERFSGQFNVKETREKYGIPTDLKIIISVGRNHIVKGFKYAVEALPSITSAVPNARYLIVGRDTEPLQELAENLGVGRKVILLGEISDREELIKIYRAADIYLSPSLTEGFSLTNIEALASGLPLVVTDVPGNRDIYDKNYSLLIEPRSPGAIAESCIEILQNDAMRKEMSRSAIAEAPKYDWLRIAELYIDSYLKAIRLSREM